MIGDGAATGKETKSAGSAGPAGAARTVSGLDDAPSASSSSELKMLPLATFIGSLVDNPQLSDVTLVVQGQSMR